MASSCEVTLWVSWWVWDPQAFTVWPWLAWNPLCRPSWWNSTPPPFASQVLGSTHTCVELTLQKQQHTVYRVRSRTARATPWDLVSKNKTKNIFQSHFGISAGKMNLSTQLVPVSDRSPVLGCYDWPMSSGIFSYLVWLLHKRLSE